MCKLADSHVIHDGAPVSQLSTLGHLAGREVVVWADGVDIGTFTVDPTGTIYFGEQVYSKICAGLAYEADFISMKLAYDAKLGSAVNRVKRIEGIGFVLEYTHHQGLRYGGYDTTQVAFGSDFNSDFGDNFSTSDFNDTNLLDDLPGVEEGANVSPNTVWRYYDEQQMEWPGDPGPDTRIRLKAAAPRPATVIGVTFTIDTNG